METRQKVEKLFKYYPELKKNLDILKFQIDNFSGMSDEQVIESMNYSVPDGERVSTSNIADKPARIALTYQDVTDRESQEMLQELTRRYMKEKGELDVFVYCISLLEPKLSDVITDLVVNRMTWIDAAEKYEVSLTMVGEYRKKGIREVSKMLQQNFLFNLVG